MRVCVCIHVYCIKILKTGTCSHVHSRFIETFGTHIVVGVKMGGKDVIYMKQQHSSTLQPADIQKKLKDMADKRFLDANGQSGMPSEQGYKNGKVRMVVNFISFNS